MTSGFESAINEAMAELKSQRRAMEQLQGNLDRIRATVRSKRRQVSVTVDARGEITELTFHGQSYRTMPPADLAKLIVETIQDAKQAAQEEVWGEMYESHPEDAEFARTAAETGDWSSLLDDVMTLPKPLQDLLHHPPDFGDSQQFADVASMLSALAKQGESGTGLSGTTGGSHHEDRP
jgi:DNA-binding protein YbaB